MPTASAGTRQSSLRTQARIVGGRCTDASGRQREGTFTSPTTAHWIVGRKRGILTDTIGLILAVTVTAAVLSENAVGIQLLDQAKKTCPTISKSWVDTGFKDAVIEHGAKLGIDVEVLNRNPGVRGFHVVKRRWAVERSIGWIVLHRRLARGYETLPPTPRP